MYVCGASDWHYIFNVYSKTSSSKLVPRDLLQLVVQTFAANLDALQELIYLYSIHNKRKALNEYMVYMCMAAQCRYIHSLLSR